MAFSIRAAALCSSATITSSRRLSYRNFAGYYNPKLACSWKKPSIKFPPRMLGRNNTTCAVMMMSTSTSRVDDEPQPQPPTTSPWLPKPSPWLMLPPITVDEYSSEHMVYQFYSLGDKRVISLKKTPQQGDGDQFWPDNNCVVVGSSRGWVVWFDSLSRSLFLSNPLTRRHLKLSTPALQPDHHDIPTNSDDTRGGITSIMISSPNPDTDPECRAVVIYGPQNKLAFCCPGTAAMWTPLGQRTGYASCVYSTSQKLFFCCFTDKLDDESTGGTLLEAWDLQDPLSPRMIPMAVSVDKDNYPVASGSDSERKRLCKSYRFLVVAEQSDELFHVRRFVENTNDDDHTTPYTTVGFDVHKYVPETGSLEYMEGCLQGQALFVGSSNGFALPAEDYPDDLERCCVYYTAPPQWVGGGYDVGFFHNAAKTLHPCFYPCDVQIMEKVTNPPIWFSPTPLVRFPFLIRKEGGALGYNIDPSSPSGQPPTRDERENARQRKEASRGTYKCVYCGFKCDSKTHNGYHSFSYHACTWL